MKYHDKKSSTDVEYITINIYIKLTAAVLTCCITLLLYFPNSSSVSLPMPINIHTLAPYGTNRLHLKIAKAVFTNARQRKAFFASPLWYSLEKYLRMAFPFNKVPKLPAHHKGSSPTTLSKSTESFLLTLVDSWSGPQKPTFFKSFCF